MLLRVCLQPAKVINMRTDIKKLKDYDIGLKEEVTLITYNFG